MAENHEMSSQTTGCRSRNSFADEDSVLPTGPHGLRPQNATLVPSNNLTVLDVIALILNKMVNRLTYITDNQTLICFQVGTGIFTNPAAVMVLTKSKTVSMVLWFVGGLYSFIWWV